MGADAGSIRAGQAYVEVTADDAPMMQRLAASQARLKAWAAQASQGMQISKGTEAALFAGEGGKGFFSGGIRGTDLFGTGIKFAAAIGEAKVAMADARIFSNLFAGDMDGARKATEALPFGLGEIVKELSGPVDSAANALIARLTGTWQMEDLYAGKSSKADLKATVDQYNRGEKAIGNVDDALAKATMSARDLAKYEVDGMKLSSDAAGELLAKKLQLIDIDERKKAADKQQAAGRAVRESAFGESQQLNLEYEKLGASAAEAARLEAKAKGYSDEWADSIARDTQAVEDRKAALENAAIAAQNEIDAEVQKYQDAIDVLMQMERETQKAESLREQMMTPEERGKARVEELLAMEGVDPETRRRAIQEAMEAAGRAMPAPSVAARGQFGGQQAWMLGAMGVSTAALAAAKETAKNTAKIAQLAAQWGVAQFTN